MFRSPLALLAVSTAGYAAVVVLSGLVSTMAVMGLASAGIANGYFYYARRHL